MLKVRELHKNPIFINDLKELLDSLKSNLIDSNNNLDLELNEIIININKEDFK